MSKICREIPLNTARTAKKFPPYCWPASNWRAGEFPLNTRILSLIGMPADVSVQKLLIV